MLWSPCVLKSQHSADHHRSHCLLVSRVELGRQEGTVSRGILSHRPRSKQGQGLLCGVSHPLDVVHCHDSCTPNSSFSVVPEMRIGKTL